MEVDIQRMLGSCVPCTLYQRTEFSKKKGYLVCYFFPFKTSTFFGENEEERKLP